MHLKENGNTWPFKQIRPTRNTSDAIRPTAKELEWIESFDKYLTKADALLVQRAKGHVELYYLMWAASAVVKREELEFQAYTSPEFVDMYRLFLNKVQEMIKYSNDNISRDERKEIMKIYGKHPRMDTNTWVMIRPQ